MRPAAFSRPNNNIGLAVTIHIRRGHKHAAAERGIIGEEAVEERTSESIHHVDMRPAVWAGRIDVIRDAIAIDVTHSGANFAARAGKRRFNRSLLAAFEIEQNRARRVSAKRPGGEADGWLIVVNDRGHTSVAGNIQGQPVDVGIGQRDANCLVLFRGDVPIDEKREGLLFSGLPINVTPSRPGRKSRPSMAVPSLSVTCTSNGSCTSPFRVTKEVKAFSPKSPSTTVASPIVIVAVSLSWIVTSAWPMGVIPKTRNPCPVAR